MDKHPETDILKPIKSLTGNLLKQGVTFLEGKVSLHAEPASVIENLSIITCVALADVTQGCDWS
jgi:hypothetical protein